MTEERIVNEETGGEKGRKPQRFSLMPIQELLDVSELYAAGAEKYEDHNWMRGYDWSLSYDALHRHLAAFWSGEETDPETQQPHLTCVVFHALTLLFFSKHHRNLDDRPPGPGDLNLTKGDLENIVEELK